MLAWSVLTQGLLPIQRRQNSCLFCVQPCAPPGRRLRVPAAAFAPSELSTAQQQKDAVKNIPVTQPAETTDGEKNPVFAYLTSAINGITQLWMQQQQGSKAASSVELLPETAQRAAEVSELPHYFASGIDHLGPLERRPGRQTTCPHATVSSLRSRAIGRAVHAQPTRLLRPCFRLGHQLRATCCVLRSVPCFTSCHACRICVYSA